MRRGKLLNKDLYNGGKFTLCKLQTRDLRFVLFCCDHNLHKSNAHIRIQIVCTRKQKWVISISHREWDWGLDNSSTPHFPSSYSASQECWSHQWSSASYQQESKLQTCETSIKLCEDQINYSGVFRIPPQIQMHNVQCTPPEISCLRHFYYRLPHYFSFNYFLID